MLYHFIVWIMLLSQVLMGMSPEEYEQESKRIAEKEKAYIAEANRLEQKNKDYAEEAARIAAKHKAYVEEADRLKRKNEAYAKEAERLEKKQRDYEREASRIADLNARWAYLVSQFKRLESLKNQNLTPMQKEILDLAHDSLWLNHSCLKAYLFKDGHITKKISDLLLDLAENLDFEDLLKQQLFECLSGKDHLTGELLDEETRVNAIIGVLFLGFPNDKALATSIMGKLLRGDKPHGDILDLYQL